MSTSASASSSVPASPAPRRATRVVGPRLRILLYVVFGLCALLGANSVYLASVTALTEINQKSYENLFYIWMFALHLVLGLLLIVPYLAFGTLHMMAAWGRRNRKAVKIGYALFIVGILVLVSGLLLVRIPLEGLGIRQSLALKDPTSRSTIYWIHVACPFAALWLYWLHRLAGPRIKWRVGAAYLAAVGAVVLAMVFLQAQDPRNWYQAGSAEGVKYFQPSLARTPNGKFVPERALMNDEYCRKCHPDVYDGHVHSVHRNASFNNPAYFAAVQETREVVYKRDDTVKASRWCAGCHDPVPFLSGAFDDPDFDVAKAPSAGAGITCTVCHGMTHVNSTKGNADYVLEEPLHYPGTYSENSLVQFLNNTLVKAKPEFHKKSMLKPFHKTAEFCSVCHKVHLPKELNHYREFLRGQNHFDPYLLSGVSGHGARSFYYPPKARQNCAECHMPLQQSDDFGARPRLVDKEEKSTIHNHLFPAANTGLAWMRGADDIIAVHQKFLTDIVRVDLFGVREQGTIDGTLHAPLRPEVPSLEPGKSYLLEGVVRTLKLGHLFTQGTVDSNEVWLEATVTSGDRVIGHIGGLDQDREVDPWSHFINVFMLDREGNRIARRNPQDIFVPLYDHQIPPGAAATVHFELQVPSDITEPVTVELKLNYRKFDKQYMDFVAQQYTRFLEQRKDGAEPILKLRGFTKGEKYLNELPITVMATDRVTFPVVGIEKRPENAERTVPTWERWNDYGIGLLLKGKTELRQAADAFAQVEKLNRYDGPLNLARALLEEGRNDEAVEAVQRAGAFTEPKAPEWTLAWLSGRANHRQGRLREAEQNFRSALDDRTEEMVERGFDFSKDYEVRNELGAVLFDLGTQSLGLNDDEDGRKFLEQAVREFEKTLALDSENVTAHYNLQRLHSLLGNTEKAKEHFEAHERYKPDENARDHAVKLAREKYPAADRASNALVIYWLNRVGAPGLDSGAQSRDPSTKVGTPTTGD